MSEMTSPSLLEPHFEVQKIPTLSLSLLMAGATFFLFQPPITTAHAQIIQLKPLDISSKSVPQFPSKIKKRKNHLRPKILKTLTKPLPASPIPQILPPEITSPPPIQNDAVLDDQIFEKTDEVFEKIDETESFNVTESVSNPVEYSGRIVKFSVNSVLKFGGFFIGVYMFLTVVANWSFGNDESENKDRSFDGFNSKGKVFLNGDVKLDTALGNVVYYDEEKLEERVSEIREMARKAREMEMRGKERSSENGIGKEIGAGLDRIGKRLNAKREKMPEKVMEYMGLFEGAKDEFSDDEDEDEDKEDVNKEDVREEEEDSLEEDKKLMFKKTSRFRSPSVNQRSKPKGFPGLKNPNGSGAARGRKASLNSEQSNGRELDKKRKDLREGRKNGVVQGSHEEKLSNEVTGSQNLNGSKLHSSGKLAEENQELTTKSGGYASSGRNDSRKTERRTSINKIRPKQSEPRTDAWWMKLPYVLAILMRRGPDNDAAGFFSLSTSSQSDEQDSSYTVVFEDRSDANNFCYLLDSFFEELGDFRADIVPLSTEEVKSQYNKVIAVKKGQLKLYAGQPMEDVEMALRMLLEQNQSS